MQDLASAHSAKPVQTTRPQSALWTNTSPVPQPQTTPLSAPPRKVPEEAALDLMYTLQADITSSKSNKAELQDMRDTICRFFLQREFSSANVQSLLKNICESDFKFNAPKTFAVAQNLLPLFMLNVRPSLQGANECLKAAVANKQLTVPEEAFCRQGLGDVAAILQSPSSKDLDRSINVIQKLIFDLNERPIARAQGIIEQQHGGWDDKSRVLEDLSMRPQNEDHAKAIEDACDLLRIASFTQENGFEDDGMMAIESTTDSTSYAEQYFAHLEEGRANGWSNEYDAPMLDASDLMTPLTQAAAVQPYAPRQDAPGPSKPTQAEMDAQRKVRSVAAFSAVRQARQALADADRLLPLRDGLVEHLSRLTPTAAEKHDAMSARAFESLWVQALIAKPPTSTLSAWQQLSYVLGARFAALTADERQAIAKNCYKQLISHGPRNWEKYASQVPRLHKATSDADRAQIIQDILSSPLDGGWNLVGRLELLRDLSLAFRRHRDDLAPWHSEADRFYTKVIRPLRGQIDRDVAYAGIIEDVGAGGITAPHQVTAGLAFPPSERPATTTNLEIHHGWVARSLNRGHVLGVGISGSTNIFLHMAQWAHAQQLATVPAKDLALGAAMFLVQDGGHSIYEVLYTMNNTPTKTMSLKDSRAKSNSYMELIVAFGDDKAMQDAVKTGFANLEKHREKIARLRSKLRKT